MSLPARQSRPAGVREVKFGETEFFEELVTNFVLAVGAGIMLVFAVLVLLYRRILPPFVNMDPLLLAPLAGVLALPVTGIPVLLPVFLRALMSFVLHSTPPTLYLNFSPS